MTDSTTQQTFDFALEHHRAGRFAQAEEQYRQILAQQPEHFDATHFLGVLCAQTGRYDIAENLLRRALVLKPDHAEAHNNLGNILKGRRRPDEAIAEYRRAIELNGDYSQAHYNLAIALQETGRLEDAITAFRQAITLNPNHAEAQNNLGSALRDNDQFEDASAAFRRAIALRPSYAQAHANLANTLKDQGQFDDAIAAYRRSIALDPNSPQAHFNLGISLSDKHELDDAIAAYRRAIELDPNFPQAHANLGNALKEQGRLDEAMAQYRHAIALDPQSPKAHNNLGNVLKDQGQIDEAITAYRQAVALDPRYSEAHSNLLMTMHYDTAFDAGTIDEEHRRWNRQHADPLRKFIVPLSNDHDPDRRLRVGYVSGDFRNHVVGRFVLPLMQQHDRTEIEAFCYSNVAAPDAMTARFRSAAHHWREIARLNDQQATEQIRADAIDILVDLAGHTTGHRLLVFARKPAPVQVSYLGYPDSTGLSTIDFRLGDRLADPPELAAEAVHRLPVTNWCFAPPLDAPPVQPSPVIRAGYVTFGSFNNLAKVTRSMLALWAEILRQVPGSRLLLKATAFSATSAIQRIQSDFAALGVDAERLRLHRLEPDYVSHLALYSEMDIALDTFPYHGTSTTCDALWMGVPVVTLAGQTHVSRVGLSLLTNLALPELIARTPDEYAQIAIALAADMDRLQVLRGGMRARMLASPLMDAPQFARDVEAAYRQMWRTWCRTAATES